MTFRDVVDALLARWALVLVCAFGTIGVAFLAVQDEGVYWTRTEVVFLAPASKLYPNSLKTTSEDLIITAGAVAKTITGPGLVTKYTSPDVNLVGTGAQDGWSIRLPDTGGQWASDYSRQALLVEVVGPDESEVRQQREDLVDRIATELDTQQRAADVDPVNDITIEVGTESSVVHHVSGSKIRAFAMTGLLGAGACLGLVLLLEHRARRRAGLDPPSPSPARERAPRPRTVHLQGIGQAIARPAEGS